MVVISTHGEGEPPASAKKFYDYVQDDTLKLSKTNFAVIALGDSAYPLFCKAGEDVDERLTKLGGVRMYPIQKCDVDYETEALHWFDNLLPNIGKSKKTNDGVPSQLPPPKGQGVSGRKFYSGKILSSINLNGRGSKKETFHIEVGCEEAIDALGGSRTDAISASFDLADRISPLLAHSSSVRGNPRIIKRLVCLAPGSSSEGFRKLCTA